MMVFRLSSALRPLMRLGLPLIGVLGTVPSAGSAFAVPDSSTFRFPDYQPLSPEALVSPGVRFSHGVPMVSLGIEEQAPVITLESNGPVRVMLDEAGIPKTLYVPSGDRLKFSLLSGQPAIRRWWARVAIFDLEQRREAELKSRRFAQSGDVRIIASGALMAISGAVLDTRHLEVLVGGFSRLSEAEALVARLGRDLANAPTVRPTLVRRATGRLQLRVEGSSPGVYAAVDRIYVGTAAAGRVEHKGRSYGGHLYVVPGTDGGLALVQSVDAETLLRGVVPAEIFASAPRAALETQAIVARGAVLSHLGHRHHADAFHLCDEQHCQVYKGEGAHHPSTDAAVAATRGRLAVRPRASQRDTIQLVESVYSANCGGHTEGNDVVWAQRPSPSLRPRLDGPSTDPALAAFKDGITDKNLKDWLAGIPPTYCARSGFAPPERLRWEVRFDEPALSEIGRSLGVGALRDVEVLSRGRGGRVSGVRVQGQSGTVDVLRELTVRRTFGGLRSGAFALEKSRRGGVLSELVFRGAGWGHGVGLCQMGAIGRAAAGQSADDIVNFYYSGALVERLY